MNKEIVEEILKQNRERGIDTRKLTSYPEYYVLKEVLEKTISALDKISNIDLESKVSVDVQVLANLQAKEKLSNLFAELGVYTKSKQLDKSYN